VQLQRSLERRGYKHANVGHKFIYVFLALSPRALIQKYVAGLDLGFGLDVLAWFNITED